MNIFEKHLSQSKILHVQQVYEAFEIVLGWETRNRYKILDDELRPVAYAAEESKGIGTAFLRLFLGHWRTFKVIIFNEERKKIYDLHFPFRWFFKTLILADAEGARVGHLQQRFAIFRKKFDVYDRNGSVVARINSSFFRLWTFEFFQRGRSIGKIQKKWSGILTEIFTDKDNFVISYRSPTLSPDLRALMLATCIMVDIVYFENNQPRKSILNS
jgi:uncharacterized protein YxjI